MLSAEAAREPAPGLTVWTAFHPEWKRDVSCVAYETGTALVLVDPLAPPRLREARRFWKALDACAAAHETTDVLLTLHYHERSAAAVAERYGAAVWAPGGSEPRLARAPDRVFRPGDRLPGGIEALPAGRDEEVVLWIPGVRAVVAGDALLGAGPRSRFRVCPASWLPRGVTRADVAAALAPLRDLPVENLVPLHGAVVTEGADATLARALDEAAAR